MAPLAMLLATAFSAASAQDFSDILQQARQQSVDIPVAAAAAPAAVRESVPASGSNIWVFIVSVLEWRDSAAYSSFPKAKRRDEALVRYFRRVRSVPEDHLVRLRDREATAAAIKRKFPSLLRRAKKGDFLFVYYAGHGSRRMPGITDFVPYDAAGDDSLWPVPDIIGEIEASFKGDWALVSADCCFSGGLCQEVAAKGGRVSYGCLASAQSSSPSTGEWTFTDSMLKGFNGSSRVDRDGDKVITFGELAEFAQGEMSFVEEQLSASATTGRFNAGTKISDVTTDDPAPARVNVAWGDGNTYRGTVLGPCKEAGAKPGSRRVHYLGWDKSSDECVAPESMSAYAPLSPSYRSGDPVFVDWQKMWYPARVQDARLGLYRIRYDNFGPYWDEWVSPGRVTRQAPCAPAPCSSNSPASR